LGEDVARRVLDEEPSLQPVASLVMTICKDPWAIRRPRDLADATGITVRSLRESCVGVGFQRIEHLIISVRMVALEVLIRDRRLPLPVAKGHVGISNVTNARRQIQRARHGSVRAFRKLRLLMV
jgi:hypothetical protein